MLTRLLQQLSSSNSLTLWFAFTCGSKDLLDWIIIQHICQIVVMVSRNPPVCENWETPDNISFKQDGGLSILAEILFQLTHMEQRVFRLQMKERVSRRFLTKSIASVDFWRKNLSWGNAEFGFAIPLGFSEILLRYLHEAIPPIILAVLLPWEWFFRLLIRWSNGSICVCWSFSNEMCVSGQFDSWVHQKWDVILKSGSNRSHKSQCACWPQILNQMWLETRNGVTMKADVGC